MAEKQLSRLASRNLTQLSLDTSLKRTKKTRNRRLRRKRSKLRFFKHLKTIRGRRVVDELSEGVQVFGVADMECSSTSFEPAIKDVAEWQNLHQMAYWKSRAISLEYENRMLHQHIRNMYVKLIEERGKFKEVEAEPKRKDDEKVAEEVVELDEMSRPPMEQVGRAEREEKQRLYGDNAPRILGMETAIQLNYDYQIEKHNPPYWPNLPIKL